MHFKPCACVENPVVQTQKGRASGLGKSTEEEGQASASRGEQRARTPAPGWEQSARGEPEHSGRGQRTARKQIAGLPRFQSAGGTCADTPEPAHATRAVPHAVPELLKGLHRCTQARAAGARRAMDLLALVVSAVLLLGPGARASTITLARTPPCALLRCARCLGTPR